MKAFTLIETLVYIALFSLILTGICSAAITLKVAITESSLRAVQLQEKLIASDIADAGIQYVQ